MKIRTGAWFRIVLALTVLTMSDGTCAAELGVLGPVIDSGHAAMRPDPHGHPAPQFRRIRDGALFMRAADRGAERLHRRRACARRSRAADRRRERTASDVALSFERGGRLRAERVLARRSRLADLRRGAAVVDECPYPRR
jgi:hypothetical protein